MRLLLTKHFIFIWLLILLLISSMSIFGKSTYKNDQYQNTLICPFDHRLVPEGLKIGAVKINGRRGNKAIEDQLSTKFGNQNYSRDLLYQVQEEVEKAFSSEANQTFEKQIGLLGGARAAIIFTKPCVEINNITKTIDFLITIYFLKADMAEVAKNILPLPRSIKPSFYNKMSAPIRVFNPQFNVNFDRKTGMEGATEISTDLFKLNQLWKGEEIPISKYRLDARFIGKKSLSNPFYQTKTDLSFAKVQPGTVVERLDFSVGFIGSNQPLNEAAHLKKDAEMGVQIKLRPQFKALNTIFLAGKYSYSSHKVFDNNKKLVLANKEDKFRYRTLIDGALLNGFSRFGLWAESTKIDSSSESYQRLAGIFAYQKEFGKGTQTLGIEALVGAGKSWGEVPLYGQFFGGNNSSNFLYESPDSITLSDFPVGPLLRSYGKTQTMTNKNNGTMIGAKSYWHTNLNISIPIPRWSKRLIPDEIITADNGQNQKLNEMLENFTIKSAIGGITGDLMDSIIEDLMKKDPTLSEDEAERLALPIAQIQAEKIVNKEIAPTMNFLSRHANLFAVKPLIMLDATKINLHNQSTALHRFGIGGGVQFVLVTARAELGYIHSFPRITGETKGNFIFRITFQNLF